MRFNAEKKKVGNYFSTPIFSFRMKHVACGGWIEIQTDPKNTAYVVIEGAKKRDTGEDKVHEGAIQIRTDEERQRLKDDAFAALEVKIDDRKQASTDKSRIDDLLEQGDKDWDDPYAASMKLRKAFRADRKVRETKQLLTEDLQNRMSLGMDLLEEIEDDRTRARFVEFGDIGDRGSEMAILKAQSKPLFSTNFTKSVVKARNKSEKKIKRPTAERVAQQQKKALQEELQQNTRAILDPFLTNQKPVILLNGPIAGIKRKRASPGCHNLPEEEPRSGELSQQESALKLALLDYDSD